MTQESYPPKDAFHWKDDIFFTVFADGSVECRKVGQTLYFHMSADSWNSVVSFVETRRQALSVPSTEHPQPTPSATGEIVERLREEARQESAADKMLADAKTARQTDREDAWTGAGYSWIAPEQTTRWQAAALIEQQAATIAELRGKLRNIISHSSGGHLSEPEDSDRSLNDICVEISRHHNRIWEHAREQQAATIAELRGHIAEQITHAETRIQDGKEMGATVWRIALEDIARENRATLERTARQ